MDPDDRKLFAQSLRHATEQHTGSALDAALVELGWHDALDDDRRDAVSLLFQMQGAANATSSALDAVLTRSLGCAADAAIVLPPLGKSDPPGLVSGERLKVRGLATSALHTRESVTVAWDDGEPLMASVATADLDVHPVPGVDPALGLVEVTAELPLGTISALPASWQGAVAAGRVAIAYELVGASQTMLRLACDHALERVQFGRPIAQFQAVRHRLAESLVALEGAQACVNATWDEAVPAAVEVPALLAKAVAGASARTVGKHAQQVLGGMGYTTEHPLHRYVRRTLVLDQLLGASRTLTRDLGAQLLRTRDLPELLPL